MCCVGVSLARCSGMLIVLSSSFVREIHAFGEAHEFPGGHYARHSAALRRMLIHNGYYDKHVPPSSVHPGSAGDDAPVDVGLQHVSTASNRKRVPFPTSAARIAYGRIRFFKLQEVSIGAAHMSIKIWWRMWWRDSRLAWVPSEHGNISQLHFLGASFASPEESEIWVYPRRPNQ